MAEAADDHRADNAAPATWFDSATKNLTSREWKNEGGKNAGKGAGAAVAYGGRGDPFPESGYGKETKG